MTDGIARCGSRALARFALALALAAWQPAQAAEERAAMALVVAVDVSQSVDDARFRLQMQGIAEALEDPGVVGAIAGG